MSNMRTRFNNKTYQKGEIKLYTAKQVCFEVSNSLISAVSNTLRVINSVDFSPFTARLNSSKDNLLHSPRAQLEDSLFMPSIIYSVLFFHPSRAKGSVITGMFPK